MLIGLREDELATELNAAIAIEVTALNARVTRHLGASRKALFEELECPALKSLPAEPYTYAEWKECKLGLDYHVEVEKHYYSVPHTLMREKMWVRITARTIEVFHRGKRVAAHVRSSSNRKHTTVREHMPSSHRRYADWTPEHLKRRAGEIGPNTSALVEIILRERPHPEQGFRASIGIIAARQCPRARSAGGGLWPGARDRRALLHLRQLDPEEQPRSPAARQGHGRAGDTFTATSVALVTSTEEMERMLTHPTLEQMRALKLDGMAEAFIELEAQDRAKDLSHGEWLALLLDRETASRSTRRFQTRLKSARLRHSQASVEDVDYRAPRRLDKALFQQLATCRWIAEHRSCSSPGHAAWASRGSACALAQKACRDGYTVHYARVPRLFAELELAHGDGRFAKLFRTLTKSDLLILDDWGPDRLTAPQRRDLMEIVEDRYGARLDPDHQPAAGGQVARRHRRAHVRRRHPRSARAQRLSAGARRTVAAQPRSGRRSACLRQYGADGQQDDHTNQASQGSQEMNVAPSIPPAPVGQQGPPARAATSDSWRSLRSARGSLLLTTGTGCVALDLALQH